MTVRRAFCEPGHHPVKIWTEDIEIEALEQVRNVAALPFIHKHVAVMPDVHWGNGTSVGTVIPTIDAIIPAAVGVDIGCGMAAHRLDLKAEQLPDNLGRLRAEIERAVPHGRTDQGGENDRGAWHKPPQAVEDAWSTLRLDPRLLELLEEHPRSMGKHTVPSALRQLGSLGTGNHFVELCVDLQGYVWLMLHSGSRGIGNKIGSYFIEEAKGLCARWHVQLPDQNLAYLPKEDPIFGGYWKALSWAQDYARTNRELMMEAAKAALLKILCFPAVATAQAVNCHHNYVSLENHYGRNVYVTRKGAVRAREGDLGIIPGSMGQRSFIVRGLGNPESFSSCSHGAGRRMSRTEAKRQYGIDDLAQQTAGVECRKDVDVIDEIPSAYKDLDVVMANQADLVEVVATLKAVLCVKG